MNELTKVIKEVDTITDITRRLDESVARMTTIIEEWEKSMVEDCEEHIRSIQYEDDINVRSGKDTEEITASHNTGDKGK